MNKSPCLMAKSPLLLNQINVGKNHHVWWTNHHVWCENHMFLMYKSQCLMKEHHFWWNINMFDGKNHNVWGKKKIFGGQFTFFKRKITIFDEQSQFLMETITFFFRKNTILWKINISDGKITISPCLMGKCWKITMDSPSTLTSPPSHWGSAQEARAPPRDDDIRLVHVSRSP